MLFAFQFLAFQFSLGDIPSALFWVACWLLGLTALMSFVEHQVHRKLMHRKGFLTQRFAALETAFQRHAVLHHGQYSKVFHDQPVDYGTDRGIQLSMREGFIESLPFSLVIFCVSSVGAIIFPSFGIKFTWKCTSRKIAFLPIGRPINFWHGTTICTIAIQIKTLTWCFRSLIMCFAPMPAQAMRI